jgi:hypothetical protein
MSALRELIATFGVEVDEKPLEHLEGSIESFKESVKGVAEVVAEAFALKELSEFVLGTVEAAAHTQDLSEQLGIGTDELQKFAFAAKLGGVDAESAAHSLGLFQRTIGEATSGSKEAAEKFAKLHISLKDTGGGTKDTLELLGDVADKLKDTDPQKRAAIAMQLFGRSGLAMIPVLKEGKEGVEDLYKEFDELGGGMSKEFVENAKKADDQMVKLKFSFDSIKAKIVAAVLPTLTMLVNGVKPIVKWFGEVVTKTHAVAHAIDTLKILAIVGAMTKVVTVLKAIAAGEALVDLLDPFTQMVIAIGVLYLAVDDFLTLMEGGNSVIGDLLGPDKQAFVDSLRESFDALKKAWEESKPQIVELGKELEGALKSAATEYIPEILKNLPGMIKGFQDVVEVIRDAVALIVKFRDFSYSLVGAGPQSDGQQQAQDIIKNANPLNSLLGLVTPSTVADPSLPSGTPSLPPNLNGGDTSHSVSQENHFGDINIYSGGKADGSSSGKETGRAVGQGITDKLQLSMQSALIALKRA